MTPSLRAAGVMLVVVAGVAPTAAQDARVSVVLAGDVDAAAAAQLDAVLQTRPLRRVVDEPRDESSVLATARAQNWPEPYVALLDVGRARVCVVRITDRTVATRLLDPDVARESPYAVALAAAELLDLVRDEPPVDEASSPAPPPAARPPSASERSLGLAMLAGAMLVTGPGGDVSLVEPALGAQLVARPWRGTFVTTLGLSAGLLGSLHRRTSGAIPAQDAWVDYDRSDLGVSLYAGDDERGAMLLGGFDATLSFVSVQATDASGGVLGEDARVVFTPGVGVALRYPIASRFFVQLGAGAGVPTGRTTYLVRGAPAVNEGAVHLRGTLLLGFGGG